MVRFGSHPQDVYTTIPEAKKWKSEKLLVPSILEK
jgi:hypothetical protein